MPSLGVLGALRSERHIGSRDCCAMTWSSLLAEEATMSWYSYMAVCPERMGPSGLWAGRSTVVEGGMGRLVLSKHI